MALMSDEQLIVRVLKGHAEDYRELMQRYQNAVFRLAFHMLGRREEAEDAAQETFLQAYKKLSTCRERSRFWSWIRRTAVNICLSKRRCEYPMDELDTLGSIDCANADPVEAEVIRHAEAEEIRKAIAGLPADYRTAVVLRYQEQLSYKEIAEILGESLIVVQTRLYRARRMLAERLGVMKNEVR